MTNPLSVTFAQVNAATWDGKYEDDEQDAIQVLIDQAARKLLAKRRRLSDWVAAGSVTHDDVVDVVARAVARVTKNPDGLASENEGEYAYKLNPLAASGDLWFPADDLAQVTPGHTGGHALGTARTHPSAEWRGW